MHRWFLLSTMIMLISAGSVRGEPWYRLYDQARDDIDHQRWESAIHRLEQAVAQRPESGPAVRVEGSKRMAYFPYFLMGKAHYHLGLFDAAEDFFNHETRVGLPPRIATEMEVYRTYLKAIEEDRTRLAKFNEAVKRARALRARGAFVEAADALRRAREYHPAEFERLGLGQTIEQWLSAERSRVEEKARRDREARFLALARDASLREKHGRLREAQDLLLSADRLIYGRPEVAVVRKRIKGREDRYTQCKQLALLDQIDGKLPQAVQALKQAATADPDRFNSEKLPSLAASLSNQIELEKDARARMVPVVETRPQGNRAPKTQNQGPSSRNQRSAVQVVSVPDPEAIRRAVLSAYEGPPEQAIKALEQVQSNRRTRNAELESAIGIAYARLSFLTVSAAESERFREKAIQHFRQTLAMDPRHKLDSRLVAPQIMDLFAASR